MLTSKQYHDLLKAKLRRFSRSQEEWKRFLETSSRMYKYGFKESVSIFAQKPNATACAEIKTWKKATNRRVIRTSEAIGLVYSTDNVNVTSIGNCYVNFGIKTTSLSGETRQDCENLNMTDCMTLYGRIAMNNPVSCETALTVNAVSVTGNTTVPLIVCRKGTFSYVNNWQTDKLLGNEKMFKMIADKAKIEAKSYNKFEEEEPEV